MIIPKIIPKTEESEDTIIEDLNDVANLKPIREGTTMSAEIKRMPTAGIEIVIVIAERIINSLSTI